MFLFKRFIFPAVAVLACCWCVWMSGRVGASRLVSDYAARARQPAAADLAARLSPTDPESHYTRAGLLADAGEFAAAARAYERAISLRPGDYVLWVELGRAREQAGDVAGALAAFQESARLAPAYAQPRWQLGNTLLRAGRAAEALVELRRAATSDPQLFPNFVELAWHATGDDARRLEEVVGPAGAEQFLHLARFLARHRKTEEAVRLFRAAEGSAGEAGRDALVKELLTAEDFAAGYEVWAGAHAAGLKREPSPGMTDGGFEGVIRLDDPGFGWRLASADVAGVKLSLDTATPRSGSQSLRVDFGGAAPPTTQVLWQLVLLEPGTHYRLSFAARTRDLVSGGLPLVRVAEVRAGGAAAPLAQTQPLPAGTTADWREFSVEFTTSREARAARVSVQRRNCPGAPCPVFGQAWFDDFSLQKNPRART